MKKTLILATVAIVLLATSCNDRKEKEYNDSMRLAEIEAQYNQAATFNDSLLLLMGDIYAGLDSINAQEGLLITPGIGDNADRRAEIRDNLSAIRFRLEQNKRLLAELEKKANDATANSVVLQRTIDQMKERIAAQDEKINELTSLLSTANDSIGVLNIKVEQTQQQLASESQAREEAEAQYVASENAANTVFYVIGTNKQLKDWKVLEKRFLGPTKVMQGDNINYTCFTGADKRHLLAIPTGAKNIEIKSINDANSYTIEGGKNEEKTIRITNPDLFWQKTPYLVVEIK